jgi:hypothetical protein
MEADGASKSNFVGDPNSISRAETVAIFIGGSSRASVFEAEFPTINFLTELLRRDMNSDAIIDCWDCGIFCHDKHNSGI